MAEGAGLPNFFSLLGLNPNDPWDERVFEDTLDKKRAEWTKASMGVGSKATEGRRNLALVDEIRRVMSDPTEREAQKKRFFDEQDRKKKSAIETFQRLLKRAQERGYVLESEIAAWAKDPDFKGILSEAEIRRQITVPIQKAPAEEVVAEPPQLDASIAQKIREDLQLLGKATLYDLLAEVNPALNARSRREDLLAASKALAEKTHRTMQKTPEVSAKDRLSGYGMRIFGSDKARQEYDGTMSLEPLMTLLADVEKVCAATKSISAAQVESYLREAREMGADPKYALYLLRRNFSKHGWGISAPEDAAQKVVNLPQCGKCLTLNAEGAKNCHHCGEALNYPCPKCGTSVAGNVACPTCGFPVGDRYYIVQVVEQSQIFLRQGQTADAEEIVTAMDARWQAGPADPVRQRIAGALQAVRQQRQREQQAQAAQRRAREQQAQAIREMMQLVRDKRLYAAQEKLDSISLSAAERMPYQQQISTQLSEAQRLFLRATGPGVAPAEQEALLLQVASLCRDYPGLKERLAAPQPPTNMRAISGSSEKLVHLTWQPSPTKGATYVVMRQRDAAPLSLKDGDQVWTGAETQCDDVLPPVGVSLYYAVFAVRLDQPSLTASVSMPVLLTAEVKNITHRVDDGSVTLRWWAPEHVQSVIVVRREGRAPERLDDGVAVTVRAPRPEVFIDKGLKNGTTYYYKIFCQFKNANGGSVTSAGVAISIIPQIPPQPIQQVVVQQQATGPHSHTVTLQWPAVGQERVMVVRSPTAPRWPDTPVRVIELKNYGAVLEASANGCTDANVSAGRYFYTPVIDFQGMAILGATLPVICIDDVTELSASRTANAIRLTWKWPTTCTEVKVAVSHTQYPDMATANAATVTLEQYQRMGHHEIPRVGKADYFIVVAAVLRVGEEVITGAGARLEVREASMAEVRYHLDVTGGGFRGPRKRVLVLSVKAPARLPAMLLRGKSAILPVFRNDGELVMRIEPQMVAQQVVIELPERSWPPRMLGRLFLEDDNDYESVTLIHPREKEAYINP